MKKASVMISILCLAMSVSACDSATALSTNAFFGNGYEQAAEASADAPARAEDISAVRGSAEAASDAVEISLNGSGAECSSDKVKISGSDITITGKGTYIVSGALDDGTLTVDADKSEKVIVVLNGVSITSKTCAAICVTQADKVTIRSASGSVNTLSGSGAFSDGDSGIDAAVFSKDDLTLDGSGTLAVNSPAGHGIVTKDDLKIKGGSYVITALKHGFSANDSIEISGGSFDITSGKDGFNCGGDSDSGKNGDITVSDGDYRIASAGDGFAANGTLTIKGGTFGITSGGGSGKAKANTQVSSKALKSASDISISGGSFTINSADDAIHSNASVTVNAGSFMISSGDDGIHADEMLSLLGGFISIIESYEGLEGLNVSISGGEIHIVSSDDGINAAGGADGSAFGGFRGDDMFGHDGGKFGKDGFGSFGGFGDFGDPGDFGDFGDPGDFGDFGDFGGFTPPDKPSGNDISVSLSADAGTPDFSSGATPGSLGENPTSEASLDISGGKVYVNAGGDGVDSNGDIVISGGELYVSGPTSSMNGAIDYERTGTVTGGTVIAVGAAGMAMNFSSAEQGSILLSTGKQEAGAAVSVTDESGKVLAEYKPEKTYETVVISCPELKAGQTYTVTAGSFSQSVTLESTLYGSGFGGFGGFGGGKGGFGGRGGKGGSGR